MILSAERRQALTAKAQAHHDNVEQVLPYLLSRGISEEVAAMFMLGCVPSGEDYAGRLTIPYVTPGGVVQLKYRCARAEHHEGFKHVADCPKYLYDAGTGAALFNAQALIYAAGLVVVTEGELDAVCVQAYAGIPAVGYPGAKHWRAKPHFRHCFEDIPEVVVLTDGDEVGRKAALLVAESIGMSARVVDMPDGQDANSFIATHGAAAFLERLR